MYAGGWQLCIVGVSCWRRGTSRSGRAWCSRVRSIEWCVAGVWVGRPGRRGSCYRCLRWWVRLQSPGSLSDPEETDSSSTAMTKVRTWEDQREE